MDSGNIIVNWHHWIHDQGSWLLVSQMNNDLYALLSDLAELESQIAHDMTQRELLRARISELVESAGGKVVLPGIARAEIRAPVVIESYDRGALDELCQSLIETNHAPIADEIRGCIKKSARSGGLSITFERKAKG